MARFCTIGSQIVIAGRVTDAPACEWRRGALFWNAGGLLESLNLSLGGVVVGLPVQCSGVFIYTSSR